MQRSKDEMEQDERDPPVPAACRVSWPTSPTPSLPIMSVSTSARARPGSLTGMPWTSATDCANRAVASTNPAVSTPARASDAPVPIPGTTALAPTAAPPPVTVAR